MSRYWKDDTVYSQPTLEELRQKVKKSSQAAANKKIIYEPVLPIQRRNICQSWWGQAWCYNLEQYADYESRLDRGKRYVKTGTVIDLRIKKGRVEAKVQGTRRKPYKVEVRISPLSEESCQKIIERCGRRIENMESLIKGEFPDANIIMCSAMGQQAMVIEAIQSGAKDFIVKPFQAERVLEAVKKVIG